jgi:SAM-dependent methyltransferase
MSDGPAKLAPVDAPALDDIILGDDDQTVPIPVPTVRKSAAPPAKENDALARAIEAGANDRDERASTRPQERLSNRAPPLDPAKEAARKRQKLTLRIPDDEISRPQLPATTPMGGIPALGPSPSRPPSAPDFSLPPAVLAAQAPAPLQPNRIISIGSADDTLELPAVDLAARGGAAAAPGVDNTHEAGWTPYQPQVADHAVPKAPLTTREPARTIIDEPGMGASLSSGDERTSVPPMSEDIPIDTDEDEPILVSDRSDELQTNPRLPAAPDSSQEIKIVDDGERHTDPGDVPEVDADDLVSVESIPNAHSPHAPPPLKGAAKAVIIGAPVAVAAAAPAPAPSSPSSPPAPPSPQGVTATSLMAGVAPAVGTAAPPARTDGPSAQSAIAVTPIAPAVAQRAPLVGSKPPPPAQAAASASEPTPQPVQSPREAAPPADEPYTAPAAGTPMARRQQPVGGPFGFMPQVGALAPPPMNEAAANRKKIRPWWEDLFNDDFIRTMAKISDADIAREANFIEESLGCEAGATILDLACGTGRHAVELASRGYQVVGFDLSLSMLARASDEAQERGMKINFVQGDMREMTFEETFDGVFSWNTSFGFFDEEKNAAVIAKVHRSLKKGGQFLLDVINRDSLIRSAPSLAWFEGDGCICMDEMQIDFITSRMKVKRTLMMDDGRTKEIEYSIRVYSLHELGKMLHDNGFRVAEVSGRTGTPGVFFGCESPRTLILAEKR